jgi:hypothetical protein
MLDAGNWIKPTNQQIGCKSKGVELEERGYSGF